MSIKYKIPLTMLIALSLNIILLIGFYRFALYGRVRQYQVNMQQTVETSARNIKAHINGMSFDKTCEILENLINEHNLLFTLTSVESGRLFSFGADNSGSLGFSQNETVRLSDGYYILEVQKNIQLFNFRSHDIFRDLLTFEIIIVSVIFVVLGWIIHFRYVRSLLRLNRTVNGYRSGKILNITPRGKDEIGKLEESFFSLSQKLYEEKQTQNRIIASISHDIKTPLTSVLGYSEQVLKKNISEERRTAYLKRIQFGANEIAAIVEEFDGYLSSTIPQASKMRNYTVSYICQMLVDEYSLKINDSGGVFSVENSCDIDHTIRIDLPGLRRVFANIIGNSIRHSGVENLEVKVMVHNRGENIIFHLSDNGIGVSATEIVHIFEPFYTSDKSRRLSGLGLAICKQLVEAMNGNISASITESRGLSIEIVFTPSSI